MRALVTGGAGFIGSHLCDALVKAGHDVRVMAQPGVGTENLRGIPTQIVEGDLSSAESLLKACEGMDVIYHLAAVVADFGPWELFRKINVRGTELLIESATACGAKRFVFMSSLAVHPFSDWMDATEEAPVEAGTNPYSRSKIEGEALVRGAHADGKLEGVIVRPGFMPFGPRDRTSFAPLAGAMEKGIYRRVGSGEAHTCTAYAENLAQGLVLCGTHPAAAGECFVLSDDGAPTWKELGHKISAALGVKFPLLPVPAPLALAAGDLMESLWHLAGKMQAPPLTSYRVRVPLHNAHFSNAKAKALLGFAPKISLDEGLARTVSWYKQAKKEGAL